MILFSVNFSLEASSGKLLHSVWILMNFTLIMDSLSISKLWYSVVWWSIRRAVSCCLQCLRYCSHTLVSEAGVLDIPNLQVGIHPFGNCPLLIMTLCPFLYGCFLADGIALFIQVWLSKIFVWEWCQWVACISLWYCICCFLRETNYQNNGLCIQQSIWIVLRSMHKWKMAIYNKIFIATFL